MMFRALALIVLSAWAGVSTAQAPEPGWEHRLDTMIEQGVRENHVPGVAIGIVRDGKLAYARGFGQAIMGQPDRPVTPDTLFHIICRRLRP